MAEPQNDSTIAFLIGGKICAPQGFKSQLPCMLCGSKRFRRPRASQGCCHGVVFKVLSWPAMGQGNGRRSNKRARRLGASGKMGLWLGE